MTIIKMAVVSDLHAFDPQHGEYSGFMNVAAPEDEVTKNPVAGLLTLVEEETLNADLLLCAGDLSEKANPAPLKYAWRKLHELKEAIGASDCIATAGNHDLDSRYIYNKYDAKGMLQSLAPLFPVDNEGSFNKYWSRNYAFLHREQWRVLLLNSSAFHGQGATEIEHGRVSDKTIDALRYELSKDPAKDINVLLCHHHVVKMGEVFGSDYSAMDGGQNLINLLESGEFGDWLIIHGHKHFPNLFYAAGGGSSPTIFSAGSLCGNIYQELGTKARNQFHILEFHLDKMQELGLGVAGLIKSWDWVMGHGWKLADSNSGLPAIAGFGYRGSITTVANKINGFLPTEGANWMTWEDALENIHELAYFLPGDQKKLIKKLEEDHRIIVSTSPDSSVIVNIGRKK